MCAMAPDRSRPLCSLASRALSCVLGIAGFAMIASGCAATGQPAAEKYAGATTLASERSPVVPQFDDLSRQEQVELLERDLRRHFGVAVRVEQIRRIAPATHGALVVDLDTAGLREGDPVLYIDPDGRAVAAGTLIVVKPLELIADYDPTLVDEGRPLSLEDFAVVNLGI